MACDSDQDICDTEHILTQDDHSADSPIVGSFQVPVNLNESSLSLFDTTPYNAISVPNVPSSIAGTKMIPFASYKAPQTQSRLPSPTK